MKGKERKQAGKERRMKMKERKQVRKGREGRIGKQMIIFHYLVLIWSFYAKHLLPKN